MAGCPFGICQVGAAGYRDPAALFNGYQGLLVIFLCIIVGGGLLSVALWAKTETYVHLINRNEAKDTGLALSEVMPKLCGWNKFAANRCAKMFCMDDSAAVNVNNNGDEYKATPDLAKIMQDTNETLGKLIEAIQKQQEANAAAIKALQEKKEEE